MSIRNRHPLGDLLHVGREPDTAIVLSDDIGPYPAGTTVHDLLVDWDMLVDAIFAPSFTANAVRRKAFTGIGPWSWARRMTSDDEIILRRAAYSSGLWVAVGDGGSLYWARDPEQEWTRQPGWTEGLDLLGVATDGTTWGVVTSGIVGLGDTIDGRIWTHSDPTLDHHWAIRLEDASVGLSGIYYANSHWVVWAATGGGSRLYTAGASPTGSWTSQDTSAFDFVGPIDIAFGNSLWVALSGNGSTISTASDPTSTWTNQGTVAPTSSSRIRYGDGHWVVARVSNPPSWATSPTGTWTATTGTGIQFTSDILYDGTRWLAIGLGPSPTFLPKAAIATDPTGAWTPITAPTINEILNDVEFDGRVYVAVGRAGASAIDTALSFGRTQLTADAKIV